MGTFLLCGLQESMNYRHAYHAGNFADVFKHAVLILLIEKLKEKETPFCILDTHAGAGMYDLESAEARKSGESAGGVRKILQNCPPALSTYGFVARKFFPRYPGSPRIARELMRERDRLIACELHKIEAASLKNEFSRDSLTAVHNMDGYQALKAFLPPPENRGIVLIDPPFERGDEFELLAEALKTAAKRWRNGIFAAWYPMKDAMKVNKFLKEISSLPGFSEHSFSLSGKTGLGACGIAVINTPWRIPSAIKKLTHELEKALETAL